MRRGFTLVELLVTIACASIALLMISTTLILITNLNNDVIDTSSNYYKLTTIREYVTNNCNSTNYTTLELKDGDVSFNGNIIVTNTNVTGVTYSPSDTTNTITYPFTITYTLTITDDADYIFYVILKEAKTNEG